MSRKLLAVIAVTAAFAAALPSALSAHAKQNSDLAKGDLVVTFSGSGGGGYRFHQPALGVGGSCRVADTTYTEIDSYHWIYRFVVPPTGGSSDTPVWLTAGGELSSSELLAQCAGTAAVTSTCTQALRAPLPGNVGDLAYPGVSVGVDGRVLTVGAVGELIPASPQPTCSGLGVLIANPVQGFAQLQATVSIPRTLLASTGDVTRRFTMAGSGLYAGVALSGSCNASGCDTKTCTVTAVAGSGGGASSCSFDESYVGMIEVRVVK